MQIDKELLSEKNYTGSRLILIENEDVARLHKELNELQKSVNPVLNKLSAEYYPKVDPMYQEIQALTEKIKGIREEINTITASFKADIESIEAVEQEANLVKDKLQPLILAGVEGQLGEFEIARQTVTRDGKIYAEVFDEIEERVKQIRTQKLSKAK